MKNMLFNLQLLKHLHIARDAYKAIWELSSHFVERGPEPGKNPVTLLILHLLTTVIGGTIVVSLAHLIGMKIAFNPNSVLFALFSAFAWNVALYCATFLFSILALSVVLIPFYVAFSLFPFRSERLLFEIKSSISPTEKIRLRLRS